MITTNGILDITVTRISLKGKLGVELKNSNSAAINKSSPTRLPTGSLVLSLL